MKLYIPIFILLALLLTGCAEWMARTIKNADTLADRTEAYVRESHEDRIWVREMCRQSLRFEIAELQRKGDHAAVRALLSKQYPPLITLDIITAVLDGEVPVGTLNRPWPCLEQIPRLDSETGLLGE